MSIENRSKVDEYLSLLCNKDTSFLLKYTELPEIKRLKEIGQLCWCDHTKIHSSISARFTSFDHSLACALMAYHFTNDKAQSIAALFHDKKTPVARHSNDFRLGDPINQEASEHNNYGLFDPSPLLHKYLKDDGLTLEQVDDVSLYPIVENKRPKLYLDRLDGIIHTNLFWITRWNIDDVRETYNDLIIVKNENNEDEPCFKTLEIAEKFGLGTYHFLKTLKGCEDIYTLKFVGTIIEELLGDGIIEEKDLYTLVDEDILKIINNSRLKEVWQIFNNTKEVKRSMTVPQGVYYVRSECKNRYTDPLCLYKNQPFRLTELSDNYNKQFIESYNFEDYRYCYVKDIKRSWQRHTY